MGVARLHATAVVFALDVDTRALNHVSHMASRNHVRSRVHACYGCKTPESLDVGGNGHHLFVIDVEGDERHLLHKDRQPLLKYSDIIVECHDFFDPDRPLSRIIAERFLDSHEV